MGTDTTTGCKISNESLEPGQNGKWFIPSWTIRTLADTPFLNMCMGGLLSLGPAYRLENRLEHMK